MTLSMSLWPTGVTVACGRKEHRGGGLWREERRENLHLVMKGIHHWRDKNIGKMPSFGRQAVQRVAEARQIAITLPSACNLYPTYTTSWTSIVIATSQYYKCISHYTRWNHLQLVINCHMPHCICTARRHLWNDIQYMLLYDEINFIHLDNDATLSCITEILIIYIRLSRQWDCSDKGKRKKEWGGVHQDSNHDLYRSTS